MNQNDMIAAIGGLFPSAQYTIDFTIKVTNGVPALLTWNNALGVQPTMDQIASALNAIQLKGYQSVQSAAIAAAYQTATYSVPVAYMGTTFFTDQTSQNMLTGALVVLTAAGATPAGFSWWDSTDTAVPMTLAQLQGLALAILTMFNTNFVKQKALIAEIAAATTIAEVQAITW